MRTEFGIHPRLESCVLFWTEEIIQKINVIFGRGSIYDDVAFSLKSVFAQIFHFKYFKQKGYTLQYAFFKINSG